MPTEQSPRLAAKDLLLKKVTVFSCRGTQNCATPSRHFQRPARPHALAPPRLRPRPLGPLAPAHPAVVSPTHRGPPTFNGARLSARTRPFRGGDRKGASDSVGTGSRREDGGGRERSALWRCRGGRITTHLSQRCGLGRRGEGRGGGCGRSGHQFRGNWPAGVHTGSAGAVGPQLHIAPRELLLFVFKLF